jgi:TolB protein
MLSRAFRLTDKFAMALSRISAWATESVLLQLYDFRVALVESLATIYAFFSVGRAAVSSPEERRRAMMARRAELSARYTVREDPLKSQNRALSLFTLTLMAALVVIVLWFTSTNRSGPQVAVAVPGTLSLATATPNGFPTVTPTPTSLGQTLNVGGTIVYSLRQNGHENLWAKVITQAQPVRLTADPSDDLDPAWSPDGTRIAFDSHRDGNWELYVMDVATLAIKRLTFTPDYEAAPTWSPDGKFIAFEGYYNNSLNIYIVPSDGQGKIEQVTHDSLPAYAPAWAPDGRHIAYVSLRDGFARIYIFNLDTGTSQPLNNLPDVQEDKPAWSPDGKTIAYTGHSNGYDLIYTQPASDPAAQPVEIAQGRDPAWSPDGGSLITAIDSNNGTTSFIGTSAGTASVMALAITTPALANHPSWTKTTLQGSGMQTVAETPLYTVNMQPTRPAPPYSSLAQLVGVQAPDPGAFLIESASDSFIALRKAVNANAGSDFLGSVKSAYWDISRRVEPGQSRQSWHYAGRAFDFDSNLVFGNPPPIEVVREDVGVDTYWRVYIRVADNYQSGQLGKPLKQIPWDFASRTSGDPQVFSNGGRPKLAIPSGYYVDFTQLSADYGWGRLPSERSWRAVFSAIMFWEFDRREGLTWTDAMLQLYTQDQVNQFLIGPTALPTQLPGPSDTPGATWTPTPVPPDKRP